MIQIVAEMPDNRYQDILRIASVQFENIHFQTAEQIIAKGTPLDKVIERSKIDKAIEEIDFLRQHKAKYITEDNKICIDSGEVLKILKEI